MKLCDAAHLSAVNVCKSPLRTVLTILGLAVGIGAILTVWTLGGAGQEQVESEIARLGVDKVWITAQADSSLALQPEDGAAVTAAIGAETCAGAYTFGAVLCGETAVYGQLTGQDSAAGAVHAPHVEAGRFFRPKEFAEGACVAVLDRSMADALGGAEAVLSRRITIGNRRMRVVGVVSDQSVQVLSACEGTVYLPLSTFGDTFGAQVSELTVSVPRNADASVLSEQAVETLVQLGGSYEAVTLQEEISAAKSVIRIFMMVLSCVAAVCMLTGGIGVMNILLVSVRERRREIGLLKAVGGTSRQVCVLFLLEAAAYAVLGGVLGVALGGAMIRIFGVWIGLSAHLTLGRILPTLVGAAVLGLLFGVVPALRAAGMVPVEALRQE